jgi:uncharacterized protein YcbK (DUF882 family)
MVRVSCLSLFCSAFLLFSLAASPADHTGTAGTPAYALHLVHLHTGETLEIVYRRGSEYDQEALHRLDIFLRDHRTGDIRHYDPSVFDLLSDLARAVGEPGGEIDVVCGYRTPWSNQFLRAHGHGVAVHSLHMKAMAIDIRMPGVPTAKLRDAAWRMQEGGVGYYGRSDFIHVDVGRVRHWESP